MEAVTRWTPAPIYLPSGFKTGIAGTSMVILDIDAISRVFSLPGLNGAAAIATRITMRAWPRANGNSTRLRSTGSPFTLKHRLQSDLDWVGLDQNERIICMHCRSPFMRIGALQCKGTFRFTSRHRADVIVIGVHLTTTGTIGYAPRRPRHPVGKNAVKLDIGNHLRQRLRDQCRLADQDLRLPGVVLDPDKIQAVMINEVVPLDPNDDFYGRRSTSAYVKSAVRLFRNAGISIAGIEDILKMGIYLTNAVKTPKTGYDIERRIIQQHASILEWELDLFPNLAVIALMGDVAKKSFNGIAKKKTGKNAIPAGSTYKLRAEEFHCGGIRILPSYIMTGENLSIEKSKSTMVSDDIRRMKILITGN